jgi:putative methionine-R-sulfoxide reductase with GAF domain
MCYERSLTNFRPQFPVAEAVPVLDASGQVRAVLDVDSDALAAFDAVDASHLEQICHWVGQGIPVEQRPG